MSLCVCLSVCLTVCLSISWSINSLYSRLNYALLLIHVKNVKNVKDLSALSVFCLSAICLIFRLSIHAYTYIFVN